MYYSSIIATQILLSLYISNKVQMKYILLKFKKYAVDRL